MLFLTKAEMRLHVVLGAPVHPPVCARVGHDARNTSIAARSPHQLDLSPVELSHAMDAEVRLIIPVVRWAPAPFFPGLVEQLTDEEIDLALPRWRLLDHPVPDVSSQQVFMVPLSSPGFRQCDEAKCPSCIRHAFSSLLWLAKIDLICDPQSCVLFESTTSSRARMFAQHLEDSVYGVSDAARKSPNTGQLRLPWCIRPQHLFFSVAFIAATLLSKIGAAFP